jgi:hypothetical protein
LVRGYGDAVVMSRPRLGTGGMRKKGKRKDFRIEEKFSKGKNIRKEILGKFN